MSSSWIKAIHKAQSGFRSSLQGGDSGGGGGQTFDSGGGGGPDPLPVVSGSQITQTRTVLLTTPRAVATALLTDTAATLYTSTGKSTPIGAICRSKIQNIVFCNTDSSARTITVYLITSGGTAGASNTILSAKSLAAGETYIFDCGDGIAMANGDFIQGKASVTNVVTHRISLTEYL